MRDRVDLKNGQSWYISSSAFLSSVLPLKTRAMAVPIPSQTGRWNRVWVHPNTQGIARSFVTPPDLERREGRLPSFMFPISRTGVHKAKNSLKPLVEYTVLR